MRPKSLFSAQLKALFWIFRQPFIVGYSYSLFHVFKTFRALSLFVIFCLCLFLLLTFLPYDLAHCGSYQSNITTFLGLCYLYASLALWLMLGLLAILIWGLLYQFEVEIEGWDPTQCQVWKTPVRDKRPQRTEPPIRKE